MSFTIELREEKTMRPKKVILLCGDTEERLEEVRFILMTRGFAVIEPSGLLRNGTRDPEAAMIVQSVFGDEADEYMRSAVALINEFRRIPILFLKETSREATTDIVVDAFYPSGYAVMEWVERLRILTARKRGRPKNSVEEEVAA